LALILNFSSSACAGNYGGSPGDEIPVGDVYVIWPSGYHHSFGDIVNDDPVNNSIARICRDLESLIELCPNAGIEYGTDIPAYSNEWFEDNAVIVLAFLHGIWHEDGVQLANIAVGKLSVYGGAAQVGLHERYEGSLLSASPYTIIIEVEKKHLEDAETVAPPTVKPRV
jgi:hypothetical protein